MTNEQWWLAVDADGHVMRKSTNRLYLSEVARLKGWTIKPQDDDSSQR